VEGYHRLRERLNQLDKDRGTRGNRLFYLSAGPDQFENILTNLKVSGLADAPAGSWARVIVEKPFGTDLATARHLNNTVHKCFDETCTFRIDHFLGKETAQNIMVLRFANSLFEHLWNERYIDHVQITAGEQLGIENRAGYYEGAGALRDMVQNHLLQLLCLIAMEPPTDLSADSIRDEKVKVLRFSAPDGRSGRGSKRGPGSVRCRLDQRESGCWLPGREKRQIRVNDGDLRCAQSVD